MDGAPKPPAGGIRPDDIVDSVLGVPGAVLKTIGQPAEEKARPRSRYHAAFSGPYTVATALLGGAGLAVFHEDYIVEATRDERRLALPATVRCVAHERC